MPESVLKTDPEKTIVFASEKLGMEQVTVILKLTNTASKDIVYKVKCTSNEMFRIRPPMGILHSNKNDSVKLVFNSGKIVPENRKHYFAVYHIFKPEEEAAANKSARELWADHSGDPLGTQLLYVEFKKEKAVSDDKEKDNKLAEKAEGAGKEKKAEEAGEKKDSGTKSGEKKDADEKKEGDKEEDAAAEEKDATAEEKKNGANGEKKDADEKKEKEGVEEKDPPAANNKKEDAGEEKTAEEKKEGA